MVRFYDPHGRERAKSFLKLVDARNFKAEVRIDKHHRSQESETPLSYAGETSDGARRYPYNVRYLWPPLSRS
jgi:hypothetical protein